MKRPVNRTIVANARQMSLDDLFTTSGIGVTRHSRDANAAVLLKRIEQAARQGATVALDLRNEICQYATSAQALDLLLVERTVQCHINPSRQQLGSQPINLRYILPDSLSLAETPGLADLAHLGLHHHLKGLNAEQYSAMVKLEQATRPSYQLEQIQSEEEAPEVGEMTLLPIYQIEGAPGSVAPLVKQTRNRLQTLLKQGIPEIDASYTQQIVAFVEEAASNIREHSSFQDAPCEGFLAANRTVRRYHDRARNQWVEVFTTHLGCYDLGRGIFAALTSVPHLAVELATMPDSLRPLASLRLAVQPGVSSKPDGDGGGGGLPRMAYMVRAMSGLNDDERYAYRGVFRLVSGGAILDQFTSSNNATHDRVFPGTQLILRFETIKRTLA